MKINKNHVLVLLISSVLSLALLYGRMEYTNTNYFSFLKWNLLLGLIPLFIGIGIVKILKSIDNSFIMMAMWFAWLIFLPNSFYIITDLVHLKPRTIIPIWYDVAMLISFGWTGLFSGSMSVMLFDKYLSELHITSLVRQSIILLCLLLCGLGCYIGRYFRWNSWDVLDNPQAIYVDIMNTEVIGMGIFSVLFGMLFILVYHSVRVVSIRK